MGICFSSQAASRRRPDAEAASPQAAPRPPASTPSTSGHPSPLHDLARRAHPSPALSIRPRQPLGDLLSSSRAAVPGGELAACSLQDVRTSCNPHRLGLMHGSQVAIVVEDPYHAGRFIQGGKALQDMVHVMSFDRNAPLHAGRGMNGAGVALATQVFSMALEQVAALSPHEHALLSVADALKDSAQIMVDQQPQRISEDEIQQNFSIQSRVSADGVAHTLQGLGVGQHAFYLIDNGSLAGSHMMGLSMSRIDEDTARVSLVNPVEKTVGKFADVPIGHVNNGLESFFSGEAFTDVCKNFVPRSPDDLPIQPASGALFTDWIRSLHPDKALSSDYFDGKPLLQTPQKGGSCTVESIFALMATTLPRDAYKLAKAACLSTVREMGQAAGVMSAAEGARIEERLRSAWNGIGREPATEKFRAGSS